MFPASIHWNQCPLLGVTSRETLWNYSFLAHIAWVGPKVYPLLHISKVMQNSSIFLVFLFLILYQPFIETYYGFNLIVRSDLLPSPIGFYLIISLLNIIS